MWEALSLLPRNNVHNIFTRNYPNSAQFNLHTPIMFLVPKCQKLGELVVEMSDFESDTVVHTGTKNVKKDDGININSSRRVSGRARIYPRDGES